MDDTDLLAQITQGVVVRPGDKLVLVLGEDYQPDEEFDKELKQGLERLLPGVETVFVGGVTQLAVYRPDAPETVAVYSVESEDPIRVEPA